MGETIPNYVSIAYIPDVSVGYLITNRSMPERRSRIMNCRQKGQYMYYYMQEDQRKPPPASKGNHPDFFKDK